MRALSWIKMVILAAFFPGNVCAQDYFVRHYTNEDGLPANTLKGLAWESATQLLWVATEGGVSRWDGHHFVHSGFNEGRVHQIGILPHGRSHEIYVLADGYKSFLISNGRMRPSGRPVSLSSAPPPFAFSDSSKAIRIMNNLRLEPLLPSWMLPLDARRDSILVNYLGRIYVSTRSSFRAFGPKVGTVQFIKAAGRCLVLGEDRVWEVRPETLQLNRIEVSGLPGGTPFSFVADTDRPMPMAASKGRLYFLQLGGDRLVATRSPYLLPDQAAPFVLRHLGENGPIAIGDRYNGLYLLTPQSLFQSGDGMSVIGKDLLVTYGQALLPDGRILNSNGVLFTRSGPAVRSARPFPGTVNLFRSGAYLYASTPRNGKLLRYDPVRQTTKELDSLDNPVWVTFHQSGDTLFILGRRTAYRLDGERLIPVQRFSTDLTAPIQLGTAEVAPGRIAICEGNGVRFVDLRAGKTWLVPITKDAQVRYLFFDKGTLFICTYGEGIFGLRDGKVGRLPTDKMGHLQYAHNIATDNRGFCYISSNNGLFRVSRASLQAGVGKNIPIYYHFLGKPDGLTGTEFNGGCLPAFLILPDGSISLPAIDGPVRFHPDSLYAPSPAGQILIMSIAADGQAAVTANPEIPTNVRTVQMDLVFPFWGTPENQYAWYRLRGPEEKKDTMWIPIDPGSASFRFASLRPGAYRLELRTFNGVGPNEVKLLAIPFRIAQHWYLRPWALMLWGVSVIGLVVLMVFWRTARIRKRTRNLEALVSERTVQIQEKNDQLEEQLKIVSETNALKDRLISVIGHNIITPLRYIHQATTMMRENARSLDPTLREKAVDSINDTSLELELLSVNLLNWIKSQHQQVRTVPEFFEVRDVINHVKSLLKPIAESRGQLVTAEMICTERVFQYKDALQVILYNLVLNAIQHAQASNIDIACQYSGGIFSLSVSDNGIGMPDSVRQQLVSEEKQTARYKETDNLGKGLGVILIKDFVRQMKGGIRVQSFEGNGSRVLIHFYNLSAGVQ
ncbi:hypothetical protein GCM10023184_29050 [Flaviaesturariibacter amylovorans]|uniref:Histidine kinase domain-containing protein n=2 Tax=Flaviaesturariibacter amylovorans TaxID=1084520 RepID=A0ABP8H5P1_9BACT